MAKTIYWAVVLSPESQATLLAHYPPKHPNIYAEHMTIVFKPSPEVDASLMDKCGLGVSMNVVGHAYDDKGQAVEVESNVVSRLGGGKPHVTISCANGTKPVYSNKLLAEGSNNVSPMSLTGVVARFTDKGWDTEMKGKK